jgi:hypothetical protein
MRFRGKMNDDIGAERFEYGLDDIWIGDVALHEPVTVILRYGSQIVWIASIGQLIKVQDLGIRRWQRQADKRGADEAGPAGNQNAHELSIISYRPFSRGPKGLQSLEESCTEITPADREPVLTRL